MSRILIADDIDENRYLLVALLEGNGFTVTAVEDGTSALRSALQDPPELIITDLLMPGLDGFDLCRQCRNDERTANVPILVYTATYTDPQDERLALSLGADHFLVKPQEPAVLLEEIDKLLDGAGPRTAGVVTTPDDEETLLRRHNQALVRKLTKKVRELESEIAARKRTEQERELLHLQLLQSQKMEAVGRLAGGIAHDFNNLLSVILGYSAKLLADEPGGDDWRPTVTRIHEAGERATLLTRQLLAISRKQFIRPRVLDVNDEMRETENLLRGLTGDKVDLTLELCEDTARIRADPGQLQQILMNLVVNARDAMPDGGRLTIRTGITNLEENHARTHIEADAGPFVVLTVTDTGQGMDTMTQARIFDPFFTTKEHGRGTGLGLSTVHGIVAQSGGHVRVRSEMGRGSTFEVHLPRVDDDLAGVPDPGPVAVHEEQASGTILIVDDDPALGEMLRDLLESGGHRVLQATSTDAALEIFRSGENHIDLLLTDVLVPKTGGVELARTLKEIDPDLRILFMSGYTGDAIAHRGMLDSGVNLLEKPVVRATLLARVHEALYRLSPP